MININLHIIEECKSTNSSLIKLANEGYPEGYSLLSVNQTCGKGTRKRKWVSIPGNLFLSTLVVLLHNYCFTSNTCVQRRSDN